MAAFDLLAPFIQEYIYAQGWTELRDVQTAACHTIFHTDHHLLLSSGTASGKTEAAFLPALTVLWRHPADSVGILYISPLKALINDQFERLDGLLKDSGIPVCRWHADASVARKRALENQPRGILQITPESLESLIMRKPDICRRMFEDTRFIIVDEVHAFMSGPRGRQLICLINRLARLTGTAPRRIGLSATLSDPKAAGEWLRAGSERACDCPDCPGERKRLRVKMDSFPREEKAPLYSEIFHATLGRKAIVFANSRGETEEAAAELKKLAEKAHAPDAYRVHHGSLSAALRQDTELEMKKAEESAVTCATLTLELGIDIGRLDCVVQLGAPFTVSSLVQRMGRCGRRGQPAELLFLIREEMDGVPWELAKGIAILELYRKEKWTEPGRENRMDFSLLFHQTLSELYASGEMRAARLAERMLTLPAFSQVDREDYARLLRDMIARNYIEKTERGGLILGSEGEMLCNHYDFFSVFETREETEVRFGNEMLGTVTGTFQPGDGLRLGGRAWRVTEAAEGKIQVVPSESGEVKPWESLAGAALHERIVEKMREVLTEREIYPYMTPACARRLEAGRREYARLSFMVSSGGDSVDLYPWMDSRQLLSLSLVLASQGYAAEILPSRRSPIYLRVACKEPRRLSQVLSDIAQGAGSPEFAEEFDFPGKYTPRIPRDLAEKSFVADALDVFGMRETLKKRLP